MVTTNPNRRTALSALAAGTLGCLPGTAPLAQSHWKADRPIRLIVPYPAGGSTDIIARVLSQAIGTKLGQPIVVENRPGAAGAIGSQAAYTSPGDGHTLVIGATDTTIAYPFLSAKQIYKPDELIAVAPIGIIPFVLAARPTLEVATAPEVIALAKRRELSYASWGSGSAAHLATALFMRSAGLPPESMLHVPYTGSAPAAQAVAAGQVDLLFAPVPLVAAQKGLMKNIALIHPRRVDALPEVATLSEQGVSVRMEGEFWMGVLAPPRTPDHIVATISSQFAEAIATPDVKTRMAQLSVVSQGPMSPKDYGAFFAAEFPKWGRIIRDAGIKPV